MKKIKLTKGLNFNKEAISKLNEGQLSTIKGGVGSSRGAQCSCCRASCNPVLEGEDPC